MPGPDVEGLREEVRRAAEKVDAIDRFEENRLQGATGRWMQGRRKFRLIKCGCEREEPVGVRGWLCDHREVIAAAAVAATVAVVAGLTLWVWWPPDGGPPVGEPPKHGGTTVSGTATTPSELPSASLGTRHTPTPTIATIQPTTSVSMPTVTMTLVATSRPPYTMPPTAPTAPPTQVVTRTVTPAPTPNLASESPSIEPAAETGTILPSLPTTVATVAMVRAEQAE